MTLQERAQQAYDDTYVQTGSYVLAVAAYLAVLASVKNDKES